MSSKEKSNRTQKNEQQPSDAASAVTSRRSAVGSGAAGAAALLLGFVAAACGDDDDPVPEGSGGKGGASSGGASNRGGGTAQGGGTSRGGATNSEAGAAGHAGEASGGTAGAPQGGAAGSGGAPGVSDADIEPLNALLSAEYNAITAYTAGAGLIADAPSTDPLSDVRDVITAVAVSIQAQHKLHAEALVAEIERLGGTPVAEDDVADAFAPPSALLDAPTISNVLKFAASAERGAAVAYNQVLSGLEDAHLRFLASSIEGDESQHFIVLAALVLGLAVPGPKLSEETAVDVVPQAFVSKVGSVPGLETAPPDYYP